MAWNATTAQKEPSASLAALRASLAQHLRQQRQTITSAWVAQLRTMLSLPRSSGLPDPATHALSYKELDRLLQALSQAVATGRYDQAVAAAAANHHEPLEHAESIARLLAKLNVLGDILRRSVIADPLLPTTEALYLLDRVLGKVTAEAVLVFSARRRQGFERVSKHSSKLQEMLQTILDSSPVGILVTDRDGIITYFNREQERLSGVPRAQALGRKLYQDYASRTDQDIRDAFSKALEHGVTTSFIKRSYPGRQGNQVLDVYLGPIRGQQGEISGTVHVCRDVTDLSALEAKLTARNNELAAKVRELEEAYTYIGRVNRQFASLIDVNSTLGSQLSLDKVLDFIVRSAAMMTRARLVTLRRLDGKQLVLASHYGFGQQAAAKYKIVDVEKSVIGRVVREKRQILVVDLSNDTNFQWPELVQNFGLKRLVSVPLHSRGRTIGTLSIHLPEQRQFSNLELNFLIALANQAALAIDLERTLRPVRTPAPRPPASRPVPATIGS